MTIDVEIYFGDDHKNKSCFMNLRSLSSTLDDMMTEPVPIVQEYFG